MHDVKFGLNSSLCLR